MKFTKKEAQNLSTKIEHHEIYNMLQRAAKEIENWRQASRDNKSMSRGAHWNTFKCYDVKINNGPLASVIYYRLIREYGEFLPKKLWPDRTRRNAFSPKVVIHQEPIFSE